MPEYRTPNVVRENLHHLHNYLQLSLSQCLDRPLTAALLLCHRPRPCANRVQHNFNVPVNQCAYWEYFSGSTFDFNNIVDSSRRWATNKSVIAGTTGDANTKSL